MTSKENSIALPCNIVLIGIMGSGKTSVGKELSRRMGLSFVDTDALIEEQAGKSIPEIFADQGEGYFRSLETSLLTQLHDSPRSHIISTGGGIVQQPENRPLLKRLGYVVWLNASLDALFDRVSRHTNRPLLYTPNPKETLRQINDSRLPLYRESAHLGIDTTNLTVEEIAIGIIESARFHFNQIDQGNRA